MYFRLSYFAVLLVITIPVAAQDQGADVRTAFAHAQHLKHGINANRWFAQSAGGDYSAAHTDHYIDAQDIALMAHLGFDNVRLSIDPIPLEQQPLSEDGLNNDFVRRLDLAVDTILADGLAVQIDMHPENSYRHELCISDRAVDELTTLWRKLAHHYANRDSDRVFFEILNEPEVNDPYRWAGIQARLAAAIRGAAPRNTIIATGPNYSTILDLLTLNLLADGNVIYNFHFYDPLEFTHQGASWVRWRYTHGIPYPPTDSSMQEVLEEVPDATDRYALENYWLSQWGPHRIQLLIDEAASWAKVRKVPLICNEFGAYNLVTDPVSRNAWIHDVRTALETDGIGWTMWGYRDGFGVVLKQEGQPAQPDLATVGALGLTR